MLRRELAKEGIEVRRRQIGTLHAANEHSRVSGAVRHQQGPSWAHHLPVPAGRSGTPEIVNTDQGSQFTAAEFANTVLKRGCMLSMDGRGVWRDNVFMERLCRSVKYERVYLRAYDTVSHARADIGEYIDCYNTKRQHTRIEDQTPEQAHWKRRSSLQIAAQHKSVDASLWITLQHSPIVRFQPNNRGTHRNEGSIKN